MTARVREAVSTPDADRPKRSANTFLRIMKHEWRNLSADRTVWIVAVLFALIIGYGIYNGAAWTAFQKKTIASAAAEEQDRLARFRDEVVEIRAGRKQPAPFSDPTLPATVGNNLGQRYAAMPPAPLAALSVGQSDLQSYYFKVSTRSKRNFINNDEIENPTILMSGRFDPAFVLIYLYPLLILALSYNLISGEREQGTLAMLLSQPVTLRAFVLSKAGLRATVIFAMAIVFTLPGIALGGIAQTGEGVALRLAMWASFVIAYGAFWFALAIGVGALGKSSATNAVALAGLWLAFVVLVPSLVNITATTAYPVSSRVEMMNAARDASNTATAEGSRLLARYYEVHPELVAGAEPDMNDFAARRKLRARRHSRKDRAGPL